MSTERVREYFKGFGIDDRIIEHDCSTATVELAAEAAGCEPERIAKSITFKQEDGAVLIVGSGDSKVDNRKYKDRFGMKAKMLSPEEVKELIGYEVGGVCPFAVNEGVTVYLDDSLRRFETVFPACGGSNSTIEMTIEELERYSGCNSWVDVFKY